MHIHTGAYNDHIMRAEGYILFHLVGDGINRYTFGRGIICATWLFIAMHCILTFERMICDICHALKDVRTSKFNHMSPWSNVSSNIFYAAVNHTYIHKAIYDCASSCISIGWCTIKEWQKLQFAWFDKVTYFYKNTSLWSTRHYSSTAPL